MKTKRFYKYLQANQAFFILLESALLMGLLYLFRFTDLLDAPSITSHISNFIGSIILMLFILRPDAFRLFNSVRTFAGTVIAIGLNLVLELGKPIDYLNLPHHIRLVEINTPDPVDALYGLLGIMIVLSVLVFALTKKHLTVKISRLRTTPLPVPTKLVNRSKVINPTKKSSKYVN